MNQSNTVNRRFVLARRPEGEPDENTLRLETVDVPKPAKGRMLLRNEYLSLDPYMRGRMSDAPSYAAPVGLGAVMVGGTVAQVVTSDVGGFRRRGLGRRVRRLAGLCAVRWQGRPHLGRNPEHPSWALGFWGCRA